MIEALGPALDRRRHGGKAAGLSLVIRLGLQVPEGFVVPADASLDGDKLWSAVARWAERAINAESGRALLAVRSSGLVEDGDDRSHAGEYLTVLDEFTCKELREAIRAVRASAGATSPIPVIVQRLVDSSHSGVAFSCDPVTFSRNRRVVSWTSGIGQALVAGDTTGSTLTLDPADARCPGSWPAAPEALAELLDALDLLQGDIEQPVDVEWAIDRAGKMWMLQARPIVLPPAGISPAASANDLTIVPAIVASHPKIRLRSAALREGVPMSRAVAITASATAPEGQLPLDLPSDDASALSAVLLHPNHLDSKVQREFAQVDRTDVPLFTMGCRRYAIRRYPAPGSAGEVVADMLTRGLQQSWVASVVLQEIYNAEATGIVRRIGEDYLVELARGHFVPKGVVDPSSFIISSSGSALSAKRVDQEIIYHFINGYVVKEQPVERQLDLSDEEVAQAVLALTPLFKHYPDAALEFGVLRLRTGLQSYVIDVAESDLPKQSEVLTRSLIDSGVVSAGRATGRVVRLRNDEVSDIDTHLLSSQAGTSQLRDTVFFAERASVELLDLVHRCGMGCAFVFRRASILAHLCVVLRERGLPAVVLDDEHLWDTFSEGTTVTVDAVDSNKLATARVSL